MTTRRRPPGRYDEPRRLPRPVLIATAGALGLGLLALTFLAWQRFAPQPTTVTVLGFRVVDDRAVEIRFRVDKDAAATVTCTAGAYDRDHRAVGTAVFTVGPAPHGSVVVVRSLGTTGRAVSAFVADCSP